MILKKSFLLSLSLMILLHLSLSGDEVNLSNSSRQSIWPAIGINSSGEIMVVWTGVNGKGEIYYRTYRDGAWSDVQNARIVHEYAWSNQLAVDSQGVFHMSYADGGGSLSRDIYYSYYTGSSWAEGERVYDSYHNSAWNRIDVDSNNDIHVAWYHKYGDQGDGKSSDIVTTHKSKGGDWPGNYEDISQTPGRESIHPALRVKNGNIYSSYMDGEGPRKIYFREKLGGAWQTPIRIGTGYYPALELDGSGNIHVIWSDWGGTLYYRSRMDGNWSQVQVISDGYAPLQFADIRYKNNYLVASWTLEQDGKYAVYYATKTPGSQWSSPIKISAEESFGDGNKHVQIAIDNQGYAHFVWEGEGVSGKEDVFYNKALIAEPDSPFIDVDKFYLNFVVEESGNPDPQTFRIKNSGIGTLNYSISSDKDWLTVNPQQGTSTGEWDTITVEVDASNLGEGSYSGTLTITSPDASNSPVQINLSLSIGIPAIQVNKSSLNFATEKSVNPLSQTFQIKNSGKSTLNYTISSNENWLTANPNQGTSTGEWDTITVEVDVSNLRRGTHSGALTITSSDATNSPVQISVSLIIGKSAIRVNKSSINFSAKASVNPVPQAFRIRNSGKLTMNYTISSDKSWLSVNPQEGSSSGEWDTITVEVDVSNLESSTHDGTLTITSPDASNSPVQMSISLTIKGPAIQVNKSSINFSTKEFKNPNSQAFKIRNSGKGSLNYTISSDKSWLSVKPQKGKSSGEWDTIVVKVDVSNSEADTHNGTLTIASQDASISPAQISVSLYIEALKSPHIELDKTSLSYSAYADGGNPPSQAFNVKNSGELALYYNVVPDKTWIKISPESGSSTGEWDTITVSIDISVLPIGSHSGKVEIISSDAENSPQSIDIELDVLVPPKPYPPINVQVEKMTHEGLMLKVYKNRIFWQVNSKNEGLFTILKYRIYRKNKLETSAAYVLLAEVETNVFTYYDEGFSSIEERDKYRYAVTCVDSKNKESEKTESS